MHRRAIRFVETYVSSSPPFELIFYTVIEVNTEFQSDQWISMCDNTHLGILGDIYRHIYMVSYLFSAIRSLVLSLLIW